MWRWIFLAIAIAQIGCASNKPVNLLDYMFQSDDAQNAWTLGGWDVRPDRDPEGTATRTFILNKASDPKIYEVYKITNAQIQLRYEVMRGGTLNQDGHWIRRFEEIEGGEGNAAGAVWMNRQMTPGGDGFVSRFRQDKFIFDPAKRGYVVDERGSADELQSYISIAWTDEKWGRNNHSGFNLNRVIRMFSQWQREGKIFETYDYAHGKGLVNWRWCERISTLSPMEGDISGTIFHCEEGAVKIMSAGDETHPLRVRKYDEKTHTAGCELEVISFKSYWRSELGPQWYVVYRDLIQERPLEKLNERIAHDFSLPEWQDKPNATIADLPYVKTYRPTK